MTDVALCNHSFTDSSENTKSFGRIDTKQVHATLSITTRAPNCTEHCNFSTISMSIRAAAAAASANLGGILRWLEQSNSQKTRKEGEDDE